MGKKPNRPLYELEIKAKDCYDPKDYILVHNTYFDGMRDAIREAHRQAGCAECICIYCRHTDRAALDSTEGMK